MDRVSAMFGLLVVLVSFVLLTLALFAYAPIFCSCLLSLIYTMYFFIANEEGIIHRAQEFENRFWTIFAILLSTALFFAKDSPIAIGIYVSPSIGFIGIILCGYCMHVWDRYLHRIELSRHIRPNIRRGYPSSTSSLNRLKDLGIPVEKQLQQINTCLNDIDQLLVPSTINNLINLRFVMNKEREIIQIFEECDARALNYIISHVKLGLVFYKIKDHRNFSGQHRTKVIQLLCVDRIATLTVLSKVIVLHALQGLKLQANTRAEYWVKNIILETKQDDLSELKTLTDAKGVYLDMNKLIYDDIKSDTIRQDILTHIRREAAIQQAHMQMGTKKAKLRSNKAWRKVLSDVDDTLFCSGGHYPAGIDKRYGRKVVYPGVLSFYRELDLGIVGPEEWPETRVGNLVFLSARPHFYKDVSEKHSFAKFEKLRQIRDKNSSSNTSISSLNSSSSSSSSITTTGSVTGGNKDVTSITTTSTTTSTITSSSSTTGGSSISKSRMHTTPSLLAGDIESGRDYILANDFEPLALKKFDNFKRYVSIYPEFTHVFVCDNGQGDVRAGELMFDSYPYEFEALYVHLVQEQSKTHGYNIERWSKTGLKPCFFRTYPEAALHAATRYPPLIRTSGLRRVCIDSIHDFNSIQDKQWPTKSHKIKRHIELNQSLTKVNEFLSTRGGNIELVPLIPGEQLWDNDTKVRTPYGIGIIKSFDPIFDIYKIELDWRPINIQVDEHNKLEKEEKSKSKGSSSSSGNSRSPTKKRIIQQSTTSEEGRTLSSNLETVVEVEEDEDMNINSILSQSSIPDLIQENNNVTTRTTMTKTESNGSRSPRKKRSSSKSIVDEFATVYTATNDDDDDDYDGDGNNSADANDDDDGSTTNSIVEDKDDDAGGDDDDNDNEHIINYIPATVYLQGRHISKYTAPVMPKFETGEKDRGLFSFWSSEKTDKKTFNEGDECKTPYGKAIVVEHRIISKKEGKTTTTTTMTPSKDTAAGGGDNANNNFVVVDMVGWNARAYLMEKDVEIISKGKRALGLLLRPFTKSTSDSSNTPRKKKPLTFPYAEGTPIKTSFGEGVIVRPLPLKKHKEQEEEDTKQRTTSSSSSSSAATTKDGSSSLLSSEEKIQTLGISLNSWVLADESNAMLYCTVDTARAWKEMKEDDRSSFLSSALGSLVSGLRFLVPKKDEAGQQKAEHKQEKEKQEPKFEQYYTDGAAVRTTYGNGVVTKFRTNDGFYVVNLINWTLANKKHPVAFLRKDDISYRIANGCNEGFPCLTIYGLTGNLQNVEPRTGVHIVTVGSAGMVCYLQPESVIKPLKATVGEEVLTPVGDGTVRKYRLHDDIYEIQLNGGWNATLFATGDTFSRVNDGMHDRHGPFGMDWLFRYLFFSSSSKTDNAKKAAVTAPSNDTRVTRSRSNSVNSVISASGRSTSQLSAA